MTLKHTNSNGFTLVEPLVALVVVSILLTAIAPTIILATATRIQARRVELASQAVRAYIDGIRSGAIQYPPGTTTRLEDYAAPTSSGSLDCTANAYCSSTPELYCVDFDGSGCSNSSLTDMVIQAFRLNSAEVEPSQGYSLGIRVYRADAFKEPGALKREPEQTTFTGGLGDSKAPLLETTTDIATDQTSFRDFCARLSCGKQ